MASTNKTTNYELSQYLGADKPTYLGDYNSDMLKIDAGMHQNALDIATADEKATLAGTNASTALTNAGTAQTTADTANTTANSALSKATANETAISEIQTGNTYTVGTKVKTGMKWTDGKDIYRVTLKGTKVSGTNLQLYVGDTIRDSISEVVDYNGIIKTISGFIYDINHYESNTDYIYSSLQSGVVQIISTAGNFTNGDVIVNIYYTEI